MVMPLGPPRTSSTLFQIKNTLEQIEFAPTKVPHHRRLQTAAVAVVVVLIPLSTSLFLLLCSIPHLWPFLALYALWVAIDGAPERGGRRSEWVRSWRVWDYYAGYYPCSIKKEVDLPPDRMYLFGYHPHGIIGMGAIATFGTNATRFSQHFPGIRPHLLTLTTNFKIPIYRELLLFLGLRSVSKKSCSSLLKEGSGNSICIVVGGAAESLSAHPGTADLTLLKRVGFIKVAIQQGADLVPVFSFGENDIYEQLSNDKDSSLYNAQKHFQRFFGFTLPVFHGRGLLNYNFGLMPYRRTIVSVFGRPINVTKTEKPTTEQVMEVHAKYTAELTRIWDKYKDEYARQRRRELRFI